VPVHIIYGVQTAAADPTSVDLHVTLPAAFTVTSIQLLKFAGGTGSGTALTALVPTVANLPNFPIGPLSAISDKVIVVIDGYFTQTAVYNVPLTTSRGTLSEASSLSIDARCTAPPIDISMNKQVKVAGGAFGSTATVAFGTAVSYKLTVKNESAVQSDGSTDLFLANLLKVQDQFSAPGGSGNNDVPLDISVSGFQCTPSSGAVACPTVPSGPPLTATLSPGNQYNLPPMTYPPTGAGSNGFLPAGGSFVITFDVLIKTTATCSRGQNNKLNNVGYITNSNGTTLTDQNSANNTSTPVTAVTLTGLIASPCPTPSATPAIQVDKVLLSPTGTGIVWGVPFTYEITITNTSTVPLTDLGIADALYGAGTPPFTANFLASNVTCTPACTSTNNIAPATASPLVGTSLTSLFSAIKFSLAPGQTQKVKYQVQYDAPPCAAIITGGSIINRASITGGHATGLGQVATAMPPLKKCELDATKKQTSGPTSFANFPQTLGFRVEFKNNSTTDTVTVGSLIDAMALDSTTYGNVPISYSYTCTATGVTGIPPLSLIRGSTPQTVSYANHPWGGIRLIDFESSPGAVFSPGGSVGCDLSVTLQQPSTTDSLCQGAGSPHLKNSAFMDLAYGFNSFQAAQPVWYQEVVTPLPYCVSIIVGKTAPPNVQAGGPVTFTLTVTNAGKDPVSNLVLHDSVPTAFTNVTWTCASGCGASSGSGNLNVPLTPPLAPGATVTILVTATAPSELGTQCNDDKATFEPFPALTYFEGDQVALTAAQACIQVIPSLATPTPSPTASPSASPRVSATPSPSPSPISTACAQVVAKEVRCEANGSYSYAFTTTNSTGSAMSQILVSPVAGSKFSFSPQLFNLSAPLLAGQSTTQSATIGAVKAGDKACFFVTLMSDEAPCCIVQVCPELPSCGGR
jgi:uncharacterized repeat protein (TIGR01451 family)